MGPVILSFEGRFGTRTLAEHAYRNPGLNGDRTPPAAGVAVGPPAAARVNFGRWIADCPTVGCTGAELVSLDNPVFFCCCCRNAASANKPLPVTGPDPQERRDIEAHLRARPMVATRNWMPGETVEQLRDENQANNIDLFPEDR